MKTKSSKGAKRFRNFTLYTLHFTLCTFAFVLSLFAASPEQERAMMCALMRMELSGHVVAEAQKMSNMKEVVAAAERHRDVLMGVARERLLAAFANPDEARKELAAFVDAANANPADYASLRDAVTKGELAQDFASAGKFLGDVQSWLRLREKGETLPLVAWLERDAKMPSSNVSRPASAKTTKRKRNSLRDAEAAPGPFIEAPDDGGSVLGTFGAARKKRREKALKDAEVGMAQVAEQRRIADDEYNAQKQAAATAEAAALQAHAQKLAAVEQQAVVQDQNSWKTRIKGVVATAAGAAGSAFLGNVGGRVGEAAAAAILR
ncbi:MAG: hypothetical protein IJG84_16455 [Kiritimatiellae bacterium]|nr:hypothetical protein [Kiritimatiellia bacterium]